MYENLILLGAGATAAVFDNNLPTAENFFENKNHVWFPYKNNFPHLAFVYQKISKLKNKPRSKQKRVNLTDAWLFIDTLNKYHQVIADNNPENIYYNSTLLKLRYKEYGQNLPHYLNYEYLNNNHKELFNGMYPLFSVLDKKIYCTFSRKNIVNYFLILAGWELKYLLYQTYEPHKEPNDLYNVLLRSLKQTKVSIINFNWDTYFETACKKANLPLKLSTGDEYRNIDVYLCKPHGGWNIKHINNKIEPEPNTYDHIEASSFDKTEEREVRPAMIPYFIGPDELKKEHLDSFPDVGRYFWEQHEVMKKMFEKARKIISIGYSFSNDDKHIIKMVGSLEDRQNKKLLCILKGGNKKENKDRIEAVWNFKTGDKNIQYIHDGFDKKAIKPIEEFLYNKESIPFLVEIP